MKTRKAIVVVVVLLGLVAGGAIGLWLSARDEPDREAPFPDNVPDRLVIQVDGQNRIWIAGRGRTADNVVRYLRAEKALRGRGSGRTRQPVLIQADPNAKWETVRAVADTADEHGHLLVDIIRVDIPSSQEQAE